MVERLQWGRKVDAGPPERPLWREPVRIAIGVGCLLVLLTTYQPWATGSTPTDGPVVFDGASGANDGTIVLIFAALTLVATFQRWVAEATVAPVRWVPFGLGLAMAFEYGTCIRTTQFVIDEWVRSGGHGERTIAFIVLGLSIAAVIVGAALLVGLPRLRARFGWGRAPRD